NFARFIRGARFTNAAGTFLLAHDLFRKPVPTFRDHALVAAATAPTGTDLARRQTERDPLSRIGTTPRPAMNIMPKYLTVFASPSRWWITISRRMVSVTGVVADVLVIVAISCVTGAIYHLVFYDDAGSLADFAEVGLTAATVFVLPGIVHGDYELSHYLSFKPHIRRATTLSNIALLSLLLLGFLIKTTGDYSRGAIILFYLTGLPAILTARYALVHAVLLGSKVGLVAAQRVFLIGRDEDINTFLRRYEPWDVGLQTVGTARLTPLPAGARAAERRQVLEADLKRAIESARTLSPQSVFGIAPRADIAPIDPCGE